MDNASSTAANEYREAQRQFMTLYQQYLVNEGVQITPESAQTTVNKMMVSAAREVASKNLEDLNDFARDYLVPKQQ